MKYVYEHKFDILFRIPARDIAFRPYAMLNFVKTCNYFTDFIPKYELTVKIKDKDLEKLRLYDKEITVFIKDYIFYGITANALVHRELDFESEFACYYDKGSLPTVTDGAKTAVSSDIDDSSVTYKESLGSLATHEIKFYLLLKDDLRMKTYIHNYIFGSEEKPVTPMDAVVAIIDQNPYIKHCIIDTPDNTSSYTDMIIEPAELKNAIKNIQYKYGIYSKSLELFYDDGILYVLNKMNIKHSFETDQLLTTSIKLFSKPGTYRNDDGVYIGGNHVIYERQSKIKKEDYESILGILSGNKFVYSNFGTVVNSAFATDGETEFVSPLNEIERPRPARLDVGTKKILDYDMLNNPYNMSSYAYEESKGVPITFLLPQVNPNHFKPNNIVKMKFDLPSDEKLYSGIYNIESVIFIYTASQNPLKRFSATANAILKLCNKQEGYDTEYYPKLQKATTAGKKVNL